MIVLRWSATGFGSFWGDGTKFAGVIDRSFGQSLVFACICISKSLLIRILSLQWIIGLKKKSEMSSEIAAEFGFFPVSTKTKARWACANIFLWLKSYIISFLYLFGNLLLLREDPSQIWNRIDGNICGAVIEMALERVSLTSACRSIL